MKDTIYLDLVVVIIVLISQFGCTHESNKQVLGEKVYHPIPGAFDLDNTPVLSGISKLEKFEVLKRRIENAQFEVGVDVNMILGSIIDIDFDDSNNIYLLDEDQLYLLRKNYASDRIDTLMVKGRGPGELQYPLDIEIIGNKLFVADLNLGITQVDLGSTKEKVRIVDDISILNIEPTNNGLYFEKRKDETNADNHIKTIEYYDGLLKGVSKQFSSAYIHAHHFAVAHFSDGLLEYVPDSDILISGDNVTPIVTAFVGDSVVWKRQVPDYEQFEAWTNAYQISWHEKHTKAKKPYDLLKTLEYIDEGVVLIQFEKHVWPVQNEGDKILRSYLIDAATGESLRIADMPLIMAFTKDYFISFERLENSLYSLYKY